VWDITKHTCLNDVWSMVWGNKITEYLHMVFSMESYLAILMTV
jgi:hypothetical protein